IAASLLKGLDIEEALLLTLVAGVLWLGRSAFYRPASIFAERFTPVWVVSIVGVIAATDELDKARAAIEHSDQTLANAALNGDKRLLFNEDASAFVMYQVAGRSWIALGDPVGPETRTEE